MTKLGAQLFAYDLNIRQSATKPINQENLIRQFIDFCHKQMKED